MAEQEPDFHNFSTSSSHRLPTVSGTQALQNELQRARGIPTGLKALDQLLIASSPALVNTRIRRGHVTEIYGPPGVGKTTFGVQIAVNAIRSLDSKSTAVWISTGTPLVQSRLAAISAGHDISGDVEPPSSPPQPGIEPVDPEDRFLYLETQSLPRLLTLLMHPTAIFPPPSTSVIIVDDLSNLILGSFPKVSRKNASANGNLKDKLAQKATSRRFQVIENLASSLMRLAASRHVAIVVLNKATISLRVGQRAVLKPALSGQAWDAAINTRIVLYRDFGPSGESDRLTAREKRGYRLAAVVRLAGRDVHRETVPFIINDTGVHQIAMKASEGDVAPISEGAGGWFQATETPSEPILLARPVPTNDPFQPPSQLSLPESQKPTKRKAIEIADSEGKDEEDVGTNAKGDMEPELPPLDGSDLRASQGYDDDEMLFDMHDKYFAEKAGQG